MENAVAAGLQRIRVLNAAGETTYDVPTGDFPNLNLEWTPVPCQHCDMPTCIAVCPVAATSKRDDGIVIVDNEKCIGCGKCVDACPYGARQMDEAAKIVDKCQLCAHRLDGGIGTTMCQICCPNRAIVVGDLDDPSSAVSKIVAEFETKLLNPENGTNPNVHYWYSVVR
jgi:molybdopterin-containing oxidoreductase family iron-sulfur binding subunit/tetrathionate reductase subunit B